MYVWDVYMFDVWMTSVGCLIVLTSALMKRNGKGETAEHPQA